MLKIRDLRDSDIKAVATMDLRSQDKAECIATHMGVLTPNESLLLSITQSVFTVVAVGPDDVPVGVCGLATNLIFQSDGTSVIIGVPWCLGSDKLVEDPLAFIKLGDPLLKRMLNSFPILSNFVHRRNTPSIKWLKWMGFRFTGKDIVIGKEDFLHFILYGKDKA